jgi:ABC-2 type transport system permease protein
VSDAALVVRQGLFTLRAYVRNSSALVFAVAMPVGFLVLFCSVFGKGGATTHLFGHQVPLDAAYAGGMVAYAVAINSFSGLLIVLVTNREAGRLKRYRGTPMPPWTFIGGQVLYTLVVATAMTAGMTALAVGAFHVHLRAQAVPAMVLYLVVGVGALSTVSAAVSAWVRTPELASSVGPFAVVILGFVSGAFLPTALLPHALVVVARVFPLQPMVEGMQAVFTDRSGWALRGTPLLVLGVWFAVALVVAARRFAWTPRAGGR